MVKKIVEIYFEEGLLKLIIRLTNKIKGDTKNRIVILKDFFFQTYATKYPVNEFENSHVDDFNIKSTKCIPKEVLFKYFEHKFDLLGSGWVEIKYGMSCSGIHNYLFDPVAPPIFDPHGDWLNNRINYSNLHESKSIWQLIDNDYTPIDWQVDFKSGYRWSERIHSKRIKFGNVLGADVKVPWELSRMQHLPQIAFSFLNANLSIEDKIRAKREFQNQILDFISTNPPRYGVNWVCAMDVAIRAANWIMAYKIFCSEGAEFEKKFQDIFFRSIHEHGEFVFLNLEWNNGKRGNHYLSNICGLVFISIFLPSDKKYNCWLNFAINELKSEVDYQFFKDGGNFEYSTAYHRLSMEMVFFATSIILGISEERASQLGYPMNKSFINRNKFFTDEYYKKLYKISEFICNVSKYGYTLPQLGDNDSGRFFKLDPKFNICTNKEVKLVYENLAHINLDPNDIYYFEDHLESKSLLDISHALLGHKNRCHDFELDICSNSNFLVIKALMAGNEFSGDIDFDNTSISQNHFDLENIFNEYIEKLKLLRRDKKRTFCYPISNQIEEISIFPYWDFGLVIFKSKNLYLSVRCYTDLQQFSPKGHLHEDQFSIELSIDNVDLIKDSGSYIYTALPNERNFYRSANSHFSPISSKEFFLINNSVFSEIKIPMAEVKYLGRRGFISEVITKNNKIGLVIEFNKNKILIHFLNYCGEKKEFNNVAFSPGYGIKLSKKCAY